MGRVFSTRNILDTNSKKLLKILDGLVFLDFGFGPKILSKEEFCILPPEILRELK